MLHFVCVRLHAFHVCFGGKCTHGDTGTRWKAQVARNTEPANLSINDWFINQTRREFPARNPQFDLYCSSIQNKSSIVREEESIVYIGKYCKSMILYRSWHPAFLSTTTMSNIDTSTCEQIYYSRADLCIRTPINTRWHFKTTYTWTHPFDTTIINNVFSELGCMAFILLASTHLNSSPCVISAPEHTHCLEVNHPACISPAPCPWDEYEVMIRNNNKKCHLDIGSNTDNVLSSLVINDINEGFWASVFLPNLKHS